MMHRHVAVKTASAHHVHPRLRHPAALLVADGDHIAGSDAQTVRVAEAGREHVEFAAVRADAAQRTTVRRTLGALGEIKIAARVCLEAGGVGVPATGGEQVVVEVLIKIGFAVGVEIMQPRDLVAPDDVTTAVDHLQAKRLKQAGRVAAPCNILERGIEAGQPPHVAVRGADECRTVRQKIVAGRE